MKADWRLIAAGAVLALTGFFAGIYLSRETAPPPRQPLPSRDAITALLAEPFTDLEGKPVTLARWQGKPLIINFWATWCPPCLAEMPAFSRLQERHPEVQFVGIAIDTEANVKEFSGKNPVSYPLILGGAGAISAMARIGNGAGALPFTLAIDAAGQPRRTHLGAVRSNEAEQLISESATR